MYEPDGVAEEERTDEETIRTTANYRISHSQAWTGHCAIVPWHRRPPSTNTGAPWPLTGNITGNYQQR